MGLCCLLGVAGEMSEAVRGAGERAAEARMGAVEWVHSSQEDDKGMCYGRHGGRPTALSAFSGGEPGGSQNVARRAVFGGQPKASRSVSVLLPALHLGGCARVSMLGGLNYALLTRALPHTTVPMVFWQEERLATPCSVTGPALGRSGSEVRDA